MFKSILIKICPPRKARQLAILRRYASSQSGESEEVRVRFAPSPTGYLHLGGLRTALYNYMFAKNRRGKFILRIEDTDQTRLVPGATESLIEDLLWSGVEIDEGPGSFGGHYGPYVQSERTDIYAEAVQQLLANGTAYHCFCTERRIEILRKEALRTRQVPRYDNRCRHLTAQEKDEFMQQGAPFCIRFKLMVHNEPLNDLIYGQVKHNVSANEGDPVIMKSDKFPTYHFANVVDDHMMRVTHVFRGVEWQISTTKHLLLYNAFGWQPPEYGHLPLLVNSDGTKLSKRQGDIGIKSFRDKGYFAEALVNYVMSAGGGFEREQSQKPRIYSMLDLAQQFNIEKVNSHPSRLNPLLLDDFNRLKIVSLLSKSDTADELVKSVQTLIKSPNRTKAVAGCRMRCASKYMQLTKIKCPKNSATENRQNRIYSIFSPTDGGSLFEWHLNERHILSILQWSTSRITVLKDLLATNMSFLWVKSSGVNVDNLTSAQSKQLIACLQKLTFSREHISAALKQFAEKEKIKYATFMKTLRSMLSGLKEGPSVAEMMEILGKDVVIERLSSGIVAPESQKLSEAA